MTQKFKLRPIAQKLVHKIESALRDYPGIPGTPDTPGIPGSGRPAIPLRKANETIGIIDMKDLADHVKWLYEGDQTPLADEVLRMEAAGKLQVPSIYAKLLIQQLYGETDGTKPVIVPQTEEIDLPTTARGRRQELPGAADRSVRDSVKPPAPDGVEPALPDMGDLLEKAKTNRKGLQTA